MKLPLFEMGPFELECKREFNQRFLISLLGTWCFSFIFYDIYNWNILSPTSIVGNLIENLSTKIYVALANTTILFGQRLATFNINNTIFLVLYWIGASFLLGIGMFDGALVDYPEGPYGGPRLSPVFVRDCSFLQFNVLMLALCSYYLLKFNFINFSFFPTVKLKVGQIFSDSIKVSLISVLFFTIPYWLFQNTVYEFWSNFFGILFG